MNILPKEINNNISTFLTNDEIKNYSLTTKEIHNDVKDLIMHELNGDDSFKYYEDEVFRNKINKKYKKIN